MDSKNNIIPIFFLDFELHCDKRALIPRPETEQLADIFISRTKKIETQKRKDGDLSHEINSD